MLVVHLQCINFKIITTAKQIINDDSGNKKIKILHRKTSYKSVRT